jgi:acid phosphatase (class B)
MNNGWDEFSIPKEVARALIAMHVKRGDSIYFVTGRSQTKTETVSKTLQDDFQIPAANMNPVIFAGDKEGKTPKPSGWKRKTSKCFMAIRITTLPPRRMLVPEGSGCCARLTRPIDRCRWPESLVKR